MFSGIVMSPADLADSLGLISRLAKAEYVRYGRRALDESVP